MARDPARLVKREDAALRRLTPAESIAIGEALLTSDVMRIARPPRGPRPPSLAVALGLAPQRKRR